VRSLLLQVFLFGALVPLAIGLSGDLYVVTALQAKSALWAALAAGAALIVFAGVWGAFPLLSRRPGRARPRRQAS